MKKLLLLACLFILSVSAYALSPSSGGNYGQKTGSSSTFSSTDQGSALFGVRNDASVPLITKNLTYGPVAVQSDGTVKVAGTFTSTESALGSATGVANGASLFKMAAGIDASNNVRPIKTTTNGELFVSSIAEQATSGQGGVLNGASLVKLIGGQDSLSTVHAARMTQSGAFVNSPEGKAVVTTVRQDYSAGSVVTATWTQIVASLSGPVTQLEIFDSSGQTLELGVGSSGNEVRKILILPGGNGPAPVSLSSGDRVSVRAVSNPASVGELDINFYQ